MALARSAFVLLLCGLCIAVVASELAPAFRLGNALNAPDSIVKEYTLPQTADHFTAGAFKTFPQRFFFRDDYWNQNKRPQLAYLCVGGEGTPLGLDVLIDSSHCSEMVDLAKTTGALLVALEHRFYGKSYPVPDIRTENLKLLSTKQAVNDLAYFVEYLMANADPSQVRPKEFKWILFGGSYPGMLASFARIKYPNIIHAAIANSAPVRPSVEMAEYNGMVAYALSAPSFGGSLECLKAVKGAHDSLYQKIRSDNETRLALAKRLHICNPDDLSDRKSVAQWIGFGAFDVPAQTNDPACKIIDPTSLCDIESICKVMTDASIGSYEDRFWVVYENQWQHSIHQLGDRSRLRSPRLAPLHHTMASRIRSRRSLSSQSLTLSGDDDVCLHINYEDSIATMKNPTIVEDNTYRTWMYQTCTAWGFFQTCTYKGKCPFPVEAGLDIQFYFEVCKEVFDVDPAVIMSGVTDMAIEYGSDTPVTPRIMYVNGEIDPWIANSITQKLTPQQPVMNVTGASHHFWTHAPLPTDSKFIVEARQAIYKQVIEWTKEPRF